MEKLKKRVIKIIIIIAVFIVLLMLYVRAPIFGIPICDFEKYKYKIGNTEGKAFIYYNKKTKNIVMPDNKHDIYLLRGELYENGILKEKFLLNKDIKEIKKVYNSYSGNQDYQIYKLPKIKVNSEFKIVIYYKDKTGEQNSSVTYHLEKNSFYPCHIILPIPH